MKRPLVTNELWSIIESLLPAEPPKPRGRHPRVASRPKQCEACEILNRLR
jgi:hypothetical protein